MTSRPLPAPFERNSAAARAMLGALSAVSALCLSSAACAQSPGRPVAIVVPFAAGGGGDLVARALAPALSSRLGSTVIVENRTGAGGAIGVTHVINAPPDGHSVLFMSNGITIDPAIRLKPAYDPRKDLRAVTMAHRGVMGIFVSPKLGINSVRELIALAKASPGKLNYAFAGLGSFGHLTSEQFRIAAGIDVVAIPFNGTPPAVTATMANETQYTITETGSTRPLWESGKIKLLAIAAAQRAANMPDIPTTAESGLPGYEATFWYGAFLPAATPNAIFDNIESAFTGVLAQPDIREKIATLGFTASGMKSEEFRRAVENEVRQWEDVVRKAGIAKQ
jgi:tripartite-type tricarboxylate transporter receptor subunit TctC